MGEKNSKWDKCCKDDEEIDKNELNQNKYMNDDQRKLNKEIQEINREKQKENYLNIPFYFSSLYIQKVKLGLKSNYEFYNEHKSIIIKHGYSKKDCVHPSFYFFFDNINGIYVNFTYVYKDNNGIRYGEKKTYEDFVNKNDICIINLKLNNEKNLKSFFLECTKHGNWIGKSFDPFLHNCCDFSVFVMEMLELNLETGNINNDILVKSNQNYMQKRDLIPIKFLQYFDDCISKSYSTNCITHIKE